MRVGLKKNNPHYYADSPIFFHFTLTFLVTVLVKQEYIQKSHNFSNLVIQFKCSIQGHWRKEESYCQFLKPS